MNKPAQRNCMFNRRSLVDVLTEGYDALLPHQKSRILRSSSNAVYAVRERGSPNTGELLQESVGKMANKRVLLK